MATLPDKNTSVCLSTNLISGTGLAGTKSCPLLVSLSDADILAVPQKFSCPRPSGVDIKDTNTSARLQYSRVPDSHCNVSASSPERCEHTHTGNSPVGSCPDFKRRIVDTVSAVFTSGSPNRDGLKVPLSDHSLVSSEWDVALANYFDKNEIVSSIMYGWDLGLQDSPSPKDAKFNHPSAREYEADVQKYIDAELDHGALCGPFQEGELPFEVAASPLGTVP